MTIHGVCTRITSSASRIVRMPMVSPSKKASLLATQKAMKSSTQAIPVKRMSGSVGNSLNRLKRPGKL